MVGALDNAEGSHWCSPWEELDPYLSRTSRFSSAPCTGEREGGDLWPKSESEGPMCADLGKTKVINVIKTGCKPNEKELGWFAAPAGLDKLRAR